MKGQELNEVLELNFLYWEGVDESRELITKHEILSCLTGSSVSSSWSLLLRLGGFSVTMDGSVSLDISSSSVLLFSST